jgi:hypothetical protein
VQVALLHAELFLLLDQLAQILEIDDLRPGLPLHQVFADADPLLEDRDHRLDLGDRCGIGPELGPALCPLPIEGGELGALLAGLVEQQFALGRQQPHRRAVGRIKGGERIAIGERRVQSRDVELCGDEVALQMAQFGVVDCRVELDQHVACLDRLPVADMDGANDRGLERLHDLAAAARDDLALRRGDRVDLAEARPGECRAKRRDHGQRYGAADRRRRRLDDFECRRQKRHAVGRAQPARAGESGDERSRHIKAPRSLRTPPHRPHPDPPPSRGRER